MMHLAGYYSNVDPAGAYTALAGINDPAISVRGNNIRVASQLPFILAAAGLTAAAVFTSAQLRSPSLRTLNNMFIRPLVNAVVFGDPQELLTFPSNPRGVVPGEDLQFWMDSTPGAGVEVHYGLVWFTDGVRDQVGGEIFSVGATAASAQAAGVWVNSQITFDQALPSGTYNVVGLRVESANGIAARLVFPGGGAESFRPGCPITPSGFIPEIGSFRRGELGVWGSFEQQNPPSIDILGITQTAQVLTLDLIKTG